MNVMLKISFSLLILILNSCGSSSGPSEDANLIGLGEQLSSITTIDGQEKETALRICYAYRSKRIGLSANFANQSMVISVSNEDCNDDETNMDVSVQLKQSLASAPIVLDSSERSVEWFTEVNTDADGILEGICSDLIRGNNVTNQVNSGSNQSLVQFSTSGTQDFYVYYESETDSQGNQVVTKKTKYMVETTIQTSPQVGFDKSIEHEEVCPDGSLNSIKKIEQDVSSYPSTLLIGQ